MEINIFTDTRVIFTFWTLRELNYIYNNQELYYRHGDLLKMHIQKSS